MLRRGDIMEKEKIKFVMFYYLPNQSELFSLPQMFETVDEDKLKDALNTADKYGYKVVKVECMS